MGKIKFLIMDVDGTLTDGKIYMGENGEVMKAFDIKDGCGIKEILPTHDIIPVIITARQSKILENRCAELNITYLYQGIREKLRQIDLILDRFNHENGTNYTYSNCAYAGDDILDLPCMNIIKVSGGLVGCPADAIDEVKVIADFISTKKCGDGAIRDFIEWIIK